MARRPTARHERAARREERLDPVRWGRPRRGSLIRMTLAAVLLLTSAAVLWHQPTGDNPAALDPSAQAQRVTDPAIPGGDTGAGDNANGPAGDDTVIPAGDGTAIPAGLVGVPVRLADPTALALVRAGQRVDLLRSGDPSTAVASNALVLEVAGESDPATGGLLLALSPDEAERAVAAADQGFAILIRPG
ncbi:hypothetical protein ACQP2E_35695 [Actinoplanes sp. CA-015351]|uniref:hypothetical protein n=1 Tax=Actinoplanes sp. CA-015351 TaxID=3239897 RepID=UPI003D954504